MKDRFTVVAPRAVTIVKGKNALLWDTDGNEYIDCIAGHGVANVGHCNEAVVAAITKQANELITCPYVLENDVRMQLEKKLAAITPSNLTKTFLCNSGAEAVEAALKCARFTTGKTDVIGTVRGFHGRTMGSLSATHKPFYKEGFEPLVPGFSWVPYNNLEKLEAAITEETAAVILEPVQGEGGVRVADDAYLQGVQKLCNENGILLILDEVQAGFCRTGKMFACEHAGVQPDMLCLAKAIAGGVPLGALVCSDAIKPPIAKHGTTFGGNPLAAAAGLAAIQYMEAHNLAVAAEERGALFEKLFTQQTFSQVREFRRKGLMIGIELREKVKPYLDALQTEGVLALPAGPTVMRFLPPLTISKEEIERVVAAVVKVLS
ncbi:MAG: aspartate aminotransferase family protein [Candidatus Woesearchaeota archaeon]|nr:aspartate aminotransferase family protein [Candidatus Woesearchaeota archaeon]